MEAYPEKMNGKPRYYAHDAVYRRIFWGYTSIHRKMFTVIP